jgi:hypothetical protein
VLVSQENQLNVFFISPDKTPHLWFMCILLANFRAVSVVFCNILNETDIYFNLNKKDRDYVTHKVIPAMLCEGLLSVNKTGGYRANFEKVQSIVKREPKTNASEIIRAFQTLIENMQGAVYEGEKSKSQVKSRYMVGNLKLEYIEDLNKDYNSIMEKFSTFLELSRGAEDVVMHEIATLFHSRESPARIKINKKSRKV